MKKQVVVIHGGDYWKPREKFLAELKHERADVGKFKRAMPKAIVRILSDRKHIWQDRFPEIVRDIMSLS